MRLEGLNNLPLITVTPNFVAIFVFFGTVFSFIERISFLEIKARREAILFLFGWSKVSSIQLSPEGEMNSGRYIPRREASRYISTALHRPWGG